MLSVASYWTTLFAHVARMVSNITVVHAVDVNEGFRKIVSQILHLTLCEGLPDTLVNLKSSR